MKSVLISLGLSIAGATGALAQEPRVATVSIELTCKQKTGGPTIVSSGNITFVYPTFSSQNFPLQRLDALTQDIAPILGAVVKQSGTPASPTPVGPYGTAANIETLNIPCSVAQAVVNTYALATCAGEATDYWFLSNNQDFKLAGLSTPTTTLVLPNGNFFSQWNYVCAPSEGGTGPA